MKLGDGRACVGVKEKRGNGRKKRAYEVKTSILMPSGRRGPEKLDRTKWYPKTESWGGARGVSMRTLAPQEELPIKDAQAVGG